MLNLINYIVKISCKNELGSGFIYLPENGSEHAYIFTARHCIYGKGSGNNALKTDISITYYSAPETESIKYTLQEEDILITGTDNESEDIAILIISRTSIPSVCLNNDGPKLINLVGYEKDCFVNGIPKVTGNLFPRTLKNCFIELDKDNLNQVQVSVKDAIVDNFNADDLVEGYSGSGCFIDNGKGIYVFGLISRYEEASKRFLGINFSFVNTLLEKNSITKIEPLTIETNVELLNDIDKLIENTGRVLGRIKTNIGTLHLERKTIEDQLKEMIVSSSFTIITGKAGMGKSALVKKVLNELLPQFSIIALRGEELDKISIIEILKGIQINYQLDVILNSVSLKSHKVILIESIEKLLETNNSETILDFFNLIKSRNDVKLVVTGRSYAIEQLKIRFLKDFPVPETLEIPLLNEELSLVETQYPHIKVLLAKPGLKRILQIPFNLDKAILLKNEVFDTGTSTEWGFKQIMWEYVIENKEKQTDIKIRKQRADTFSKIAYNRAVQMVSYAKMDDADPSIIQELEQDNIIEVEEKLKNKYSPSHDIFEDWALTRLIEDKFTDWNATTSEVNNFFDAIGDEPAIRRAFRIWMSERIQEPDCTIETFLNGVLTHNTLTQFWKDEVLTVIMQSSYSLDLLSKKKELLFQNDFLIYKRCLLLLKVACQTPDLLLIKLISVGKDPGQMVYESHYLKPFGEGWANIINFTFAHISDLRSIYPSIILILLDWKKGLDENYTLPSEAEKVAAILIDYFDTVKLKYETDPYSSDEDEKLEDCVNLLLRICGAAKENVSKILQEALEEKRSEENYKVRKLNELFLESSLSYLHSKHLCYNLSHVVTKIAEKEWFYYPPTPEEIAERQRESPFYSLSRREEKEEIFGVKDEHKHNYMPPSGLQTPIKFLLFFHPHIALDFIIKLFNHSVSSYFESDFLTRDGFATKAEDRIEVKIQIDQKEIIQKGTLTLWCMYRGGHIATPYLLQSVLMALENWLLEIAEGCQNHKDVYHERYTKFLNEVIDKLLNNSQSVSITAVISSVATAFPNALVTKFFPVLKVKEFYNWDLMRYAMERKERFFFKDPQYIIKERQKSAELPHRKRSLEDLLRHYSTSGFGEQMYNILDTFYAKNPTETTWKIALNRMDMRKLEIVEQTETGFIVQTKIDDDLKDVAAKNTKDQEAMQPLITASNWSRNKYENKEVENDTYSEWQKHFNANTNYDKTIPGINLWVNSSLLAAVGIKYYFEQLSTKEKSWCLERIFSPIAQEIKKDPYNIDFDEDSPIGAFDIDSALETLPHLIVLGSAEEKQNAKEYLFAALIFINNKTNKEKLLNKVRSVLWEKAPDFALVCIAGMIEYAKISSDRYKISNWYITDKKQEKEKQKAIDKYNKQLKEIFNSVIKETVAIKLDGINENSHSIWALMDILSIIPFNTTNAVLLDYIDIVLQIIINSRDKERGFSNDDKVPYELVQIMENYYSHFLLNQDNKVIIAKTQKLVGCIFDTDYKKEGRHKDEKFEFVERTLDKLSTRLDHDLALKDKFWIILEYLFKRSVESNKPYLNETILISCPYWNPEAREWKPMAGKKEFFQKVIPHFQSVSPTVLLLSGIGFTELMPDGINWYAAILRKDNSELKVKENVFFTEKLMQRAFYDKKIRDLLKENASLRESYIFILDELIKRYSAVAFLIKEDFISLKKGN